MPPNNGARNPQVFQPTDPPFIPRTVAAAPFKFHVFLTAVPAASQPEALQADSADLSAAARRRRARGPRGAGWSSAGRGVSGARARVRARGSANRELARPPRPQRGWRREEEEEHSPSSYQRAGGGGGGTGVTNSDLSLTKTITNPPFPATPAVPPGPPPLPPRRLVSRPLPCEPAAPGLPPSANAGSPASPRPALRAGGRPPQTRDLL